MRFLRRRDGDPSGPMAAPVSSGPAQIFLDLRDRMLTTDPATVGLAPDSEHPMVWGVVIDWNLGRDDGREAAIATVLALADGTTSMYLSSGGGTIGAGEHEHIANMSKALVSLAASMIDEFPPVPDAPLPGDARTALVLLTYRGLRRIEDDNVAFSEGRARASSVANGFQELIHNMRLIQESSHPRPRG